SLTHLVCPPLCCSCGSPTGSTYTFQAYESLAKQSLVAIASLLHLHILLGWSKLMHLQIAPIALPLCKACERRWNPRRLFVLLSMLGLGGGLLLGALLAIQLADPGLFVYALLIGLTSLLVGWIAGRWLAEKTAPVHFRNFVPGKGTVDV